ncbi:metallophosphoesterase [Coprococcus eutactus]|uniref:Metallophosphoesterase n=1 Tax=Coprococcus eutactus TaxID=33043 RepID=A0A3R5WKA3_9FIRM|nr:metallophosphoesterase [Coprococcus eutactus]
MKYFLIIVAALCVITLVNILLESHRENRKISFSSYRIKDKRLKKNAKIVMISDLHNACYGEKNSELLHVVETISPDLILVAGDVIVGKTGLSVDTGVDFLNSLGESFPVFVGKGNHEMRTSIYEKYGDMWENLYERTKDKVHWLINDSIYLADYNMTIYGLDMKPEYYRRFKKLYMDSAYLEEELRKPDKRSYNILIGHDPDYFEEYAAWGADLCVSGHVHGGLIIIPHLGGLISPMIKFFPKYYKGVYNIGDSHMIVSAGMGLHTLKIRLNNEPDLVTINLMK